MLVMELIAMGVALATAPVASEPREAPAPAPTATARKAKRPTNYCIEDFVTGRRTPVLTCHTRAEWMRQGFDPLDGK